jgi:hypothetical protein
MKMKEKRFFFFFGRTFCSVHLFSFTLKKRARQNMQNDASFLGKKGENIEVLRLDLQIHNL